MTKLKSKLIISMLVFFSIIITMQLSIFATNEKIEIVKNSNTDYLIYIEDNLNSDFEFAFSNDQNIDKTTLTFKKAETDSTSVNANKIAFINSSTIELFENPTYMWAKDSNENYIINGILIDLTQAVSKETIETAANITKTIPVDTTKTDTTKNEIDGKTITMTVGKVVLTEKNEDYEYIIVELPYTEKYESLVKLATKISKFNNETDMYNRIKVYKEFNNLIEELRPNSSSNWKKVEKNEIAQPVDAKDGTQYVLWLKATDSTKQDVQFLTSYKKVSEEKIIEKITTKLPVTYDNNTLLIVLTVLIIMAVIVAVRIKTLCKKEKQE